MGAAKTTVEERIRAVAMLEEGRTGAEVAKLFGVSRIRVYQWKVEMKKRAETASGFPSYAQLARDVEQLKRDVRRLKKKRIR